jgi:hypothetical protein
MKKRILSAAVFVMMLERRKHPDREIAAGERSLQPIGLW